MLVLDTNVYLDADRDAAVGQRLAALVAGRYAPVGLSSVVAAELLAGVANADERRRFLAAPLGAVPADRVPTPPRQTGRWPATR